MYVCLRMYVYRGREKNEERTAGYIAQWGELLPSEGKALGSTRSYPLHTQEGRKNIWKSKQ